MKLERLGTKMRIQYAKWKNKEKRIVLLQNTGNFTIEAAIVIPDIPPFGEQFHFNESIQGGSHFFAYVDRFVHLFNMFRQLPEYRATELVSGESHW